MSKKIVAHCGNTFYGNVHSLSLGSQKNTGTAKQKCNKVKFKQVVENPQLPGMSEQIGGIWRGGLRVLPGELSRLTILHTQTKALNQHSSPYRWGARSIPDLPLNSRTHKLGATVMLDGWVGLGGVGWGVQATVGSVLMRDGEASARRPL